jgi:hypothetical protein
VTGSLVVPGFGGGVVKASSAEAMSTNELQEADGADIGDREQLVSAGLGSFYTYMDPSLGAVTNFAQIFGIAAMLDSADPQLVMVGTDAIPGRYLCLFRFDAVTEGAAVANAKGTRVDLDPTLAGIRMAAHGVLATFASFPYVKAGAQIRPFLVALSARLPYAPSFPPTMVLVVLAGVYTWKTLDRYDTLGTGPDGEFAGGNLSKPLTFRCIESYNNHVFGAGCDVAVANSDSPNRLMFSNLGNPLKWGNDPGPAGINRAFNDTDAINIGDAGESILALKASNGKLWIGTNRGLHYLQGFGRDTFKTDGTTGIAESLDVVGPNALEEGPDGILYGVSARGLWAYNGEVQHLYQKLVDPNGHSAGFWDLLWRDPAALVTDYPGTSNQDFVWLLPVPELDQMWVVIPFCDGTNGFGRGTDTVVIKYHTKTGGFTRQVFAGVAYTHGVVVKRSALWPDTILFTNSPAAAGASTIHRYRYRATQYAIPAAAPMSLTFGEYAPYGPNGVGVNRVAYFTVSWENAGALPITAALTLSVDGQQVDALTLTIGGAAAPVGPANGDVWLDTRGTDTNLGNATAGVLVPLTNDYLLFRWVSSWNKWVQIPRAQGMKGTRATIPIAYIATPGTRVKIRAVFTTTGRLTVESLGIGPQSVRTAQ